MEIRQNPRGMIITGWILSILPSLMFLYGGSIAIRGTQMVIDGMVRSGFPASLARPIGILELVFTALFLIPRTAFYGAILLTAYLGGAVCTHLRLGEPQWFVPIVFALVIWIGLTLRDSRLRAFLTGK